ncbi:hypothetical protein L228DRAFT_248457 [Xylona heveae TC161]|uniref:Nucleoside transporter family n=1 Tax=Xylona heveae (strain CBS 132557 / TC161) TaxID=1328760 RepID=A0A165G4G1_XYLHT|nr:hypothetical protein L228DRAFT_248457 [Xylona heveae TC161]KZF21727.1 hypothetical protein L228DRAFT_248457 [Xylona heveae TC161]
MDRLRRLFRSEPPAYEPIEGGEQGDEAQNEEKFSWIEYSIFFLLGIAMLWAWNMFLAAAPYFQHRFASSEWILTHFQSAITSVSCVTNLGSMIVLTKLQSGASYPKRIAAALLLNTITFTLLAISTTSFRSVTAGGYFGFLLTMVCATSLSTGLSQNGVFAYVTGFGRGEYTQAIMAGQAVAGVLPCVAQIVSVLSVSQEAAEDGSAQESPKSAFAYFLTATGISSISFVAFMYFVERHRKQRQLKRVVEDIHEAEGEEQAERKVVGLWSLFKKLHWNAGAVFMCFAVTMVFPVFTQAILSVRDPEHSSRIFQPASFIPLGFLVWNIGDLIGRLLTLHPRLKILHYPRMLFVFSIARVIFIPLYLLCNMYGKGAVISSDFFYLVVVQLFFGLSNGYLGSSCMMSAGEWVEVEEREAAGGFMGLFLVAGLTVGSLLSFLAA